MTRPRYNTRRDGNQRDIIAELRQLPFFEVQDISNSSDRDNPGDIRVMDVTTGMVGRFEIKTDTGKPTPGQAERAALIPVVRCVEDILRWFGRL